MMRKTLLLSAALLAFAAPAAFAPAAFAQTATTPDIRPGHVPGVGGSLPMSNAASNILPGDTHSVIAPTLPAPAGGQNASISQFLSDATRALDNHQTGRAQEALERAETAMLQRSVPADMANQPDHARDVEQVTMARDALAHGDFAKAKQAVSMAMRAS
jgi:hypothetical protein